VNTRDKERTDRFTRRRPYLRLLVISELLQSQRLPITTQAVSRHVCDQFGDVCDRTIMRDLQFLRSIRAIVQRGRSWLRGSQLDRLIPAFSRAVELQAELSEIDERLQFRPKTRRRHE